jgi:hypothetical protein
MVVRNCTVVVYSVPEYEFLKNWAFLFQSQDTELGKLTEWVKTGPAVTAWGVSGGEVHVHVH